MSRSPIPDLPRLEQAFVNIVTSYFQGLEIFDGVRGGLTSRKITEDDIQEAAQALLTQGDAGKDALMVAIGEITDDPKTYGKDSKQELETALQQLLNYNEALWPKNELGNWPGIN